MVGLATSRNNCHMNAIQSQQSRQRCLGKARVPDNDIARKICLGYTMTGARKMTSICAATTATACMKHKFRFVYLSGAAAEMNQTKPLWFMQDYRRIRVS